MRYALSASWKMKRRSAMLAAFDFQLGERVRQRGADERGFFVVEFFGKASLSAAAGFLSFGFVDVLGLDGHVGHDGNAVAGDFNETFPNSEKVTLVVLTGEDFARDDLSHERDVVW